jgi:acyl-CoA reductase-like NAD-dependent aldehyde dehydrogenase
MEHMRLKMEFWEKRDVKAVSFVGSQPVAEYVYKTGQPTETV